VTPHYDPAMVQQFTQHTNDYLIWEHYDQIDIPVLCLRGAESDLVLRETVDRDAHAWSRQGRAADGGRSARLRPRPGAECREPLHVGDGFLACR
jgi:hypothetical protein